MSRLTTIAMLLILSVAVSVAHSHADIIANINSRNLLQARAPTSADATLTTTTAADIEDLFSLWNTTLQTGDPAQVAALYDPEDGVLVPTLSNDIRSTPEEIEAYFVEFLKKQPSGVIDESYITIEGPIAVYNGIYTFSFGADGSKVPARFTYVYRQDPESGEWLILSHHSSALPEKVVAAAAEAQSSTAASSSVQTKAGAAVMAIAGAILLI